MQTVKQRDQRNCVSERELDDLFSKAFAEWTADDPNNDSRRQTPRLPVRDVMHIFVVSYIHGDRVVELNGAARIVDISADGLGIFWSKPLPIGARVRFQFSGGDGEPCQGMATVARSTKWDDGYHIGLTFLGDAASLDADAPVETGDLPFVPTPGLRGWLDRLRQTFHAARQIVTRRESSRREARRSMDGAEGLFVVEVKLFRFTAALYIDGRKVVQHTGRLNHRIRNLLSDSMPPTMIALESGDFSAWAMLRANAVTYCKLDFSLPCKHRLVRNALGAAPTRSHELTHPESDSSAPQEQPGKTLAKV